MKSGCRWQFIFVQVLTLGRMPLIFLFLGVSVFVPKPMSGLSFAIAFAAMIVAAITDLFDGYFARRFNVVTRMGAYADPLTDKVFYLTSFPTLVYLAALAGRELHAMILLTLTILFLFRDQWISFLRSLGAIHHIDAKANWSGKVRTVIAFPTICTVFYYLQAPSHWWFQSGPPWWQTLFTGIVYAMEIASLAINLISIWVYTRYYWPTLKKEMQVNNQDHPD